MTARLYLLLEEQQLEHDTEIETTPRASRKSYKTLQDTTTQGKKFSTQARTLTDSTRPIVRDASLNSSTSRRSAMTSASHGVSTYRHRCASSSTCAPPPRPPEGSTLAAGRPCGGRLPPQWQEQYWSRPCPPWMPPSLQSQRQRSSHLPSKPSVTHPPASPSPFSQTFMPLSDVVGGALHTSKRPQ
jgi:hypothetical protein